MSEELTIDDLCAETGYTRRTIRYYLQRGLVPPPEGGGRRRIYSQNHLLRLMAIKALQERQYPLEEIRHRLSNLAEADIAALLTQMGKESPSEQPEKTVSTGETPGPDSPLPPPQVSGQIVVPVTDDVSLVALIEPTAANRALLLEAARQAATVLYGRPVQWMSHPDPTVDAHLRRLQGKP